LGGCGGRKEGVFSFYITLIILGIGVCGVRLVGWVCGVWRLVGCGVGREGIVGGK
jgi:hypothetical protein